MDKQRLTELAEWLEAGAPHKKGVTEFNMGEWLETAYEYDDEKGKEMPCGAVCCIAGAAVQFFHEDPRDVEYHGDVMGEARRLLDLPYEPADALFVPALQGRSLVGVEPEQAAKVVRHLIETGVVDWNQSGFTAFTPPIHVDEYPDDEDVY